MSEAVSSHESTPSTESPWLRRAEWIVFTLLLGWLAGAAWLVRIELFDGYHNICNARYFLGHTDEYQAIRFPMMALLMLPAEALKQLLALHPLEVWPHHISMALLHGLYLIAVYAGLVKIFGRSVGVLLAFVAVIFNLMFFTMAPFITSDILPGALLLWMVIYLDRFLSEPRTRALIALVVLGFFAASIKHVFGTFWIAILLASAVVLILERRPARVAMKFFAMLAAGAAFSGVATWLLEGYTLAGELPAAPLLKRPWILLMALSDLSEAGQDREVLTPGWLYFRNLWAYGWLIVMGASAGIILAVRSRASRVERLALIVLIVVIGAMQISPIKNVRFLCVVLPVAGILAAAWFRTALQRRAFSAVVIAALCIDAYHVLPVAARIADPFFRQSELRKFLEPLDRLEPGHRVLWAGNFLSFVPERPSLLSADLYHDLYHFGPVQLGVLYGLGTDELVRLHPARLTEYLKENGVEGDLLIRISHRLVNPPTWDPTPPKDRDIFGQSIALGVRDGGEDTLRAINRCRFVGEPLAFSCSEVVGEPSLRTGHLQR